MNSAVNLAKQPRESKASFPNANRSGLISIAGAIQPDVHLILVGRKSHDKARRLCYKDA
jgi:hypothetical protein